MATVETASAVQEDEDTTRRRHKKKRNVALFEASGMTEEDRRQVRSKQRRLHQKIEGGPVVVGQANIKRDEEDSDDEDQHSQEEEEEQTPLNFLENCRTENNALFDSVRFTREAVLDADNTDLMVKKTLHEVDKLRQVARFDGDKLVRSLRSKLTSETSEGRRFDWKLLGAECGICFNAPPVGLRFLAGSIDVEGQKKARKAREKVQRHKADDAEEIRPDVIAKEGIQKDADALSAAEKDMKVMERMLKKRCKEEVERRYGAHPNADNDPEIMRQLERHGREVDGAQFLMNPRSFTQSVENVFNFSFLVKKGRAAVGVRPPTLQQRDDALSQTGLWVASKNDQMDNLPEATQAVVSFTMKDWREICQAQQLEKGDIPHRTGSRHQRSQAASQSQD